MKSYSSRTHLVSFRLSEEEYERLRIYCLCVGARSIADLTRTALCEFTNLTDERIEPSLDAELRRLYGKFLTLSERVQQLARLLQCRAPSHPTWP